MCLPSLTETAAATCCLFCTVHVVHNSANAAQARSFARVQHAVLHSLPRPQRSPAKVPYTALRQSCSYWHGGTLAACAADSVPALTTLNCSCRYIKLLAHKKVSKGWGEVLVQGIFANWLVCIATWQANAAQDLTGKAVAVWLPISAFAMLGFEHCIGECSRHNMDYKLISGSGCAMSHAASGRHTKQLQCAGACFPRDGLVTCCGCYARDALCNVRTADNKQTGPYRRASVNQSWPRLCSLVFTAPATPGCLVCMGSRLAAMPNTCQCCSPLLPAANQFLIPMAIALGAPVSAREFVWRNLIPGASS
jgi:hypothetical protein